MSGSDASVGMPFPMNTVWRWLRGKAEANGEVLSVTEAQVPKPIDVYRVLSLIMICCVFGVLALPIVIAIVVSMIIIGLLLSFLGFGGKRSHGGFSQFILQMLLLRGFSRAEQLMPRLGIRLRDAGGCSIDVVALGHVPWPAPSPGDELQVTGVNRHGVINISNGLNKTTGVQLRVPGTNWRLVFLGLVAVFIVVVLAIGAKQVTGEGLIR